MASYKDLRVEVANNVQGLTEECINKLTAIWDKTFEEEMCKNNLTKLTEHVSIFYNEVVSESLLRHKRIKEANKKLREEINNLERILKFDVSLSPQKEVLLYPEQIRLNKKLQELKDCLTRRKKQICELRAEQDDLCEQLGEFPRSLLDDPLPDEEELQDFQDHLNNLKLERINRITEISAIRNDIRQFLKELELEVQNDEEQRLLNERDIRLTKTNIERLKELRKDFQKQVEEVKESIEAMKRKLELLWNCLETSLSVREKFTRYTDYSQTTYDKFYRELDRCETQKRKNIKRFVVKIRHEIMVWWDKTLKSELERSRFSSFNNDCYTEDLLALHEMELEDLKSYYHDNERIFELISERRILWDRMSALEAKASEPGRFNNRGGQLLKEEKERKTIATKLPKIEAQLEDLVLNYEAHNNRKFLVYGEDILELIKNDWERKRSEKEKLMSARKNAITPLSRSISRTPSTKKMLSSVNLSSMPSSAKRKLPGNEYLAPNAKRNLLTDLNSPTTFVKPQFVSKTPHKSPMKKSKLIATTIRKRSGRLSGPRTRRKSNRLRNGVPRIIVSDENSLASESVSYDLFEEHIEKDPACRSSILHDNEPQDIRRRNQLKDAGHALPNPRQIVMTPSKISRSRHLSIQKSPILNRTGSPMISKSSSVEPNVKPSKFRSPTLVSSKTYKQTFGMPYFRVHERRLLLTITCHTSVELNTFPTGVKPTRVIKAIE